MEVDIKKFIKLLETINQNMKKVNSESKYLIYNNKAFSFMNENIGFCVMNLEIPVLKDKIISITGSDLYAFLKEKKKFITSIDFKKNSIEINGEEFNYIIKTTDFVEDDIKKYPLLNNDLKLVSSDIINTDVVKNIIDRNTGFETIEVYGKKIRLSKKVIPFLTTKPVDIEVKIYEDIKNNKDTFIVAFIIKNKEGELITYVRCINF